MRQKVVQIALSAAVHFLLCGDVFADSQPENTTTQSTEIIEERSLNPGQGAHAEIDALIGTFSGLRAKGIVFSAQQVNLAVEGMYGGSIYTSSGFLPATYGAGVRSEFYLFSGKQEAWMIAPGVDGYYVPSNHVKQPAARSLDEEISNSFIAGFHEVESPAFTVSPNVDLNWVYGHDAYSIVAGARVGLAVALSGAKKVDPDLGLYFGTRF